MPLIQVDMFEGRSNEQVREYVHALTEATCRLLGCTPEDVTIILRDVPRSRWSTGGVLWSDEAGVGMPPAPIVERGVVQRRIP